MKHSLAISEHHHVSDAKRNCNIYGHVYTCFNFYGKTILSDVIIKAFFQSRDLFIYLFIYFSFKEQSYGFSTLQFFIGLMRKSSFFFSRSSKISVE